MRPTLALLALAVFASPGPAQEFLRPPGWNVRFDDAAANESELEMFVAMPPGWHVTSGPAAIYWGPDMSATGTFRLEMEVFLFDPESRREAFGIFFGGKNLQGPEQAYSYFLIRDGGESIVKRRIGAEAPTLRAWTAAPAIRSYAERGQETSVKNVLAVEAHADLVRFLVNDEEVARFPRAQLEVDGIYGFRVNHGLNLHVSRLERIPLP